MGARDRVSYGTAQIRGAWERHNLGTIGDKREKNEIGPGTELLLWCKLETPEG